MTDSPEHLSDLEVLYEDISVTDHRTESFSVINIFEVADSGTFASITGMKIGRTGFTFHIDPVLVMSP